MLDELNAEERKQSAPLVWSVILLHMLNHVISGAMPILYPDIMAEFNLSYSQLGLIRSAATFAAGFPQLLVGLLRRWFSGRVLVGVGNLINAVMNIAIALSNSFWSFFGFSVAAGIGSSTQHPVGASLITAATDPAERGKMLGLNQSFPSIAFSFVPLITAYLITRMGWRSALGILSVPALLLSIYLLVFVRGSASVEGKTKDALNLGKLREQLRNKNVLNISLLRSVMAFRMGVRTFLPLYFIDILGFTPEKSSLLYSVLLFGGVFGPVFWGWLSDRRDRKPLIIGIMAASSLGYLAMNWVTSFWGLVVLLFLIGFFVQTVVVQNVLSDSVPRDQLDQIFGLYFTIGFTLASFSSIIFGYVVEIFGFNVGFYYIAAVTGISLIPAFLIKEPRTQKMEYTL
ncbi:MFS transporter [Candidatus Bathyarchaeota archaeon]|nr:MAG: MFS transporter [Candidatus Bathyarchaeota archaeon]